MSRFLRREIVETYRMRVGLIRPYHVQTQYQYLQSLTKVAEAVRSLRASPKLTSTGTWTSSNSSPPGSRSRVKELPFMLPFNQWYTNRPGTTLFFPVTNIALLYLNLLLMMFSEDTGYFIVDTDHGNAGYGLDAFRKSAGGHLHDDIRARRMFSLRELDAAICETAIQEQGIICEHISLMQQALGLGGGCQSVGSGRHLLGLEPHIYPGLGFQFVVPPGKPMRANPVGIPGVWEGPMPPFVASMKEAVTRLVHSKFGPNGTFRKPHEQTWVRPGSAQQVPEHSARAVDATIAFTEYVLATYGRFPAHADACKSVVACQK